MPQPAMIAWLQKEYSAIFWHEMAEHYIAVSNDGKGVLHFYDKDFAPVMDGDAMLVIEGLSGVKKVEFLGNVVCCLTGSGIHYLLFEKGCYRGLGERPAIPDVNITISSKVEILNTEHTYYKGIVADELESSWNYNEKGYIDECVALLNKAGYYIDRAGLKGTRIGGVQVSKKHAGFFINLGGATAEDYLELIELVKSNVLENFGIILEEEIRIIR
jgi:hypothetical protein